MPPILTINKLNKQYPGVKALDNVDFSINPGEVRALLGKNGAGKSTLIKILSGAVQPDSGEIFINEKAATIQSPRDAFELGIGTVYQEMSLVPGLTVAENILLGRWPIKSQVGLSFIDRKKIRQQAQKALDQLEVELDLNAQVSRLNVAQQQLVEIAKAISFDPPVLVLDEPTSALPSEEVEILHRVVRRLAAKGRAIMYVTHRLQEIPHVADSVTVLRDGKLVGTIPVAEASPEKIAQMMIGTDWTRSQFRQNGEPGEVKLAVRNLCQGETLRNVSFELRAGEVLGIAGLLGSGRTELLRTIFGLDSFDSGEIVVQETAVSHLTPRKMKTLGIGLTPEDRRRQGLVMPFSVKHNLTLASLNRVSKQGILQGKKETQVANGMVAKLDVKTAHLGVRTETLSGGNQQKVVVGNWLNTHPEILIMDEPSRGIDIQAKEQIFKLVRELARDGLAVLMVSSEIEEVLDVADRIIVMNSGTITHELNSAETNIEALLSLAMEEITHD
ncbi:MAG: sugar ABC transporter ATP-binding protein [Chloroflexi bacterium]|nr:MAG: sugar ABC transporter ATP-binding protein [Chloroflexota bacterium]